MLRVFLAMASVEKSLSTGSCCKQQARLWVARRILKQRWVQHQKLPKPPSSLHSRLVLPQQGSARPRPPCLEASSGGGGSLASSFVFQLPLIHSPRASTALSLPHPPFQVTYGRKFTKHISPCLQTHNIFHPEFFPIPSCYIKL